MSTTKCVKCGNKFSPFMTSSGEIQREQCSPCGEREVRAGFRRIEELEDAFRRDFGEDVLGRMSRVNFPT